LRSLSSGDKHLLRTRGQADVETYGCVGFSKFDRQGQAYVTQAYDGDFFGLVIGGYLGFISVFSWVMIIFVA